MSILIIVGVLFGMILGQFFKCFVLFPAYGLAIVLVLASPAHMDNSLDNSLLGSLLQIVVLITSLQIGYVIGSVTSNFHREPKPLNNSALALVKTRSSSNGAMSLPIAATGELLIDHTRPPGRAKRSLAVH